MVFQKSRGSHLVFGLMALALLVAFSLSGWADEAELTQIRQAIKAKGARWVAGETSISKLPPEKRRRRLGLKKHKGLEEDELAALPAADLPASEALAAPASMDWRSFSGSEVLPAGDYVTGVRNQGGCGSCWAFSTSAALESNVLIAEQAPGAERDFSEQVLVSCSDTGSCDGGWIGGASNYIRDYGLPVEDCFRYTATNNTCGNACSTYQTDTWAISSWHYVATSSPTVEAIKNALVTYGPMVTTMEVYSDFYSYRSGVYTHVSGTHQGGHGILLVGYDDNSQYFICKNSWGSGWGESGFFRIAYSEMTNAVEFGQYTIAYEGDSPPPPPPPPPACTYSISPTNKVFKSRGGKNSVSVTAQSGCAWTAVSNDAWINILSGSSGTGNGTVSYSVDPNTETTTRNGAMTIAEQTFTVKQSGVKGSKGKGRPPKKDRKNQ